MAIQHSVISDPHVHEPKGASTAGAGTVYVSDGSGSGSWTTVDLTSVDWSSIQGEIQNDLDNGSLEVAGDYYVHVTIPDISSASSVLVPVMEDSTVVSASVVLGGAISAADASISFSNSAAASMGTDVTVAEASSGKGDQYSFTATGNNVLSGPTWIEVATDGASTGAVPVYITIKLRTVLNS